MALRGGLRPSLCSVSSTPLLSRLSHGRAPPPPPPPPPRKPAASTSEPTLKLRGGALAHLMGPRPARQQVKRQSLPGGPSRTEAPVVEPKPGGSKVLIRRPLQQPPEGEAWPAELELEPGLEEPEHQRRSQTGRQSVSDTTRGALEEPELSARERTRPPPERPLHRPPPDDRQPRQPLSEPPSVAADIIAPQSQPRPPGRKSYGLRQPGPALSSQPPPLSPPAPAPPPPPPQRQTVPQRPTSLYRPPPPRQPTPQPSEIDWAALDTSTLPPTPRRTHFLSADFDTLKTRGTWTHLDPARLFRLSAIPAAGVSNGGAQALLPPFESSAHLFLPKSSETDYAPKIDGRAGSGWMYASPGVLRVLVIASKNVSKSAVERRRIMRRAKAALDLVMNRGGVELPFDHIYCFFLNAAVHDVPFAQLCERVEIAAREVSERLRRRLGGGMVDRRGR